MEVVPKSKRAVGLFLLIIGEKLVGAVLLYSIIKKEDFWVFFTITGVNINFFIFLYRAFFSPNNMFCSNLVQFGSVG